MKPSFWDNPNPNHTNENAENPKLNCHQIAPTRAYNGVFYLNTRVVVPKLLGRHPEKTTPVRACIAVFHGVSGLLRKRAFPYTEPTGNRESKESRTPRGINRIIDKSAVSGNLNGLGANGNRRPTGCGNNCINAPFSVPRNPPQRMNI